MGDGNLLEHTLLRNIGPPSVIVNSDLDILYFFGDTRKYLNPPEGNATLNLMRMIDSQISPIIKKTIRDAQKENRSSTAKGLYLGQNGSTFPFDISVFPVTSTDNEGLYVISFIERSRLEEKQHPEDEADHENGLVRALKDELGRTKEHLSATVEQLETANEELKATNEELESSNEELQSTNEELETSREELQSLNEELMTMNNEHQDKIDDLESSNRDLRKLIYGTGIGTIYVDEDLKVRKFTKNLFDLIHLRNVDEGRSISEIANSIEDGDLIENIRSTMESGEPREFEVRDQKGKLFNMKIIPQEKEDDHDHGGVIITFIEITRFRKKKDNGS